MSTPTDASPDALTAEEALPEFKPADLPPNLLATADPQDVWIMQQLDVHRQQNQEIMRQQRLNRRQLVNLNMRVGSIEAWKDALSAKTVGIIFIAITVTAGFLAYLGQSMARYLFQKAPILIAVLLFTGCTFHAAKQKKVQTAQDERGREVIQAAKFANDIGKQRQALALATILDTNTIARISSASVAYDLSGDFLRRGQSIVGLPIADQNQVVTDLLSEVKAIRSAAESKERDRASQEQGWAAERAKLQAQLIEMGEKYEAEKNKTIIKRIWHWAIGTLGIGGLIALCILCPAVIPFLTRALAWIVGKIPALAGVLGVVATKAYDSVVRGVERSKVDMQKTDDNSEKKEILLENLSKEMDADHKNLIKARLPKARIALAI